MINTGILQDQQLFIICGNSLEAGVIKVSTDDTVIPAGWEVTINQQYQQVLSFLCAIIIPTLTKLSTI